jgi:hypothetical protein
MSSASGACIDATFAQRAVRTDRVCGPAAHWLSACPPHWLTRCTEIPESEFALSISRAVCIFEAARSRKGRLLNPQYRIMLPAADARMLPDDVGPEMPAATRQEALYCGRLRSYSLGGARFVAYDDGAKLTQVQKGAGGVRQRRQMATMCFHKQSTSQSEPMMMQMLVPTPPPTTTREASTQTGSPSSEPGGGGAISSLSHDEQSGDASSQKGASQDGGVPPPPGAAAELLDGLFTIPFDAKSVVPPRGTKLLKLVPPRRNAGTGDYQVVFSGRARCSSNKNMQLADVSRPDVAALQMGKLRRNEFALDFRGCVSPFQAFAAALAICDATSLRRRL